MKNNPTHMAMTKPKMGQFKAMQAKVGGKESGARPVMKAGVRAGSKVNVGVKPSAAKNPPGGKPMFAPKSLKK
jgi:hypothetical protein